MNIKDDGEHAASDQNISTKQENIFLLPIPYNRDMELFNQLIEMMCRVSALPYLSDLVPLMIFLLQYLPYCLTDQFPTH